jgi:hypothetical protein
MSTLSIISVAVTPGSLHRRMHDLSCRPPFVNLILSLAARDVYLYLLVPYS